MGAIGCSDYGIDENTANMGIKRTLKAMVEKYTDYYILMEAPFGFDIAHDISHRFTEYQFHTIFDVGANVGQSALRYSSEYPKADVYCFEPVSATYEQLTSAVKGRTKIHCFNYALGDSVGEGTMTSEGTSTLNQLVSEINGPGIKGRETEAVNISTINEFCKVNNIEKISYLKIDTEGADLSVLSGSETILNAKRVDFVEVEAGMSPSNKRHVPFEKLKEFLENHGFYIFGIYEQVREWPKDKPNLRRSNLVFVSEKMINEYEGDGQIHEYE